jgi:predicted DNA-binding transcriptional regulator AlpA
MKYRKLMKIKEATLVTGMSRMQLYRLAREGKVIAYKLGTNSSPWLFPKGELFKWYMKRSFKTWRGKLQSALIKAHKDEQSHTPKHDVEPDISPDVTESWGI